MGEVREAASDFRSFASNLMESPAKRQEAASKLRQVEDLLANLQSRALELDQAKTSMKALMVKMSLRGNLLSDIHSAIRNRDSESTVFLTRRLPMPGETSTTNL